MTWEPGQMGCMILCRAFYITPRQGLGPEQGWEEWVAYPFSDPEAVSGGVF